MAVHGAEVILEYGDGETVEESSTWTPIVTLIDIPSTPAVKADDIETSHMLSPNQVREFDPGWADSGELNFQCQYEKTQNATLYALFRVKKGWRVLFPDAPGPSGSAWSFNGFISGYSNPIDREQLITADITIRVVGLPAFDPV